MIRLWKVLIMAIIAVWAGAASGADQASLPVIDVRTALEYKMGHLEGAINVPYDEIGAKIGSLVGDKSQKIYVYCRSGNRSKIARDTLEKLGYKNIIDLGAMKNAADILKRKIVE